MKNEFDERIKTCTCGSNDVFMRRCPGDTVGSTLFSLKCNYCQRQQDFFNSTWDDAVGAWNKGIMIRSAVKGLNDISMIEFSR